MEMEENYLDEIFDFNPFLGEVYSHGEGVMSSNHAPSSSSSSPRLISFENSNTHHRTLDFNSITLERDQKDHSPSSQIINFSSSHHEDHFSSKNPSPYHDVVNGMTRKCVPNPTRTRSQAQDHLMAERKRRENLSQLFITLSKVVPGLRKLDKSSLLEDAINYLKALQERVSDLEREEMKKISSRDVDNSCLYYNNNIGSTSKSRVPEISVRIEERHVLVKIYCKKQMDIMSRIPFEIEKMNLNVIDMRMMPFGGEDLDVTILVEVLSHN
ncbi:hypothetical protein ACS0TY_028533 [Phlomoides rotata]